jgi:hypothetical protein
VRRPSLPTAVVAAAAVAGIAAGAGVAAAPPKHKPAKHAKHRVVRAYADAVTSLFANGSFETSLAGWQGYDSTLARVSGGEEGTAAARVTVAGASTSFSIYPSPRPVSSTTAGVTYVADASVRTSTAPRKVCLRVREYAGTALVGSAQKCLTDSGAWTSFGPVSYTAAASGHSLDAYVYADGTTAGDSFDVDAVSLTKGLPGTPTPTPPPPTPTPTPPPATTSSGATATGVDNAHVALSWGPVAGASAYRVLRGTTDLGTTSGTTFTDALLWPKTTYTYSIQALSGSGAVLATLGATGTTTALPATGFPRPFAPTSFWNTPVASGAPLAANSDGVAAFLAAHATSPSLAIGEWSVPVAEAHAGDATFSVPCTLYACSLGAFGAVPIPATAKADTSSDGHLAVYDPRANREWDMWQAKATVGGWSASAGAAVSTAGDGVAAGNTASGDAANLPLLGGLVRPEEIAQGHIDHALVFGLPGVGHGAPVCPASHNAPTSSDPNAPREGTHVQLDPSVDVSSLPIPAWAKVVARAMQVYGMYLRDTSGSLGVYAENPIGRGYDPWPSVLGIAAGNDFPSLAGIPWSKFRVLAAPDYPSC